MRSIRFKSLIDLLNQCGSLKHLTGFHSVYTTIEPLVNTIISGYRPQGRNKSLRKPIYPLIFAGKQRCISPPVWGEYPACSTHAISSNRCFATRHTSSNQRRFNPILLSIFSDTLALEFPLNRCLYRNLSVRSCRFDSLI